MRGRALDIEQVTYLRYVDGDQWLTDWPSGRESVRRIRTATSVGDPEPVHELLDAEPARHRQTWGSEGAEP